MALSTTLTRTLAHSPFTHRRALMTKVALARSAKFDQSYFEDKNYNYLDWYKEQSQSIASEIHYYLSLRNERDWVFLDAGCALGGIVEVLRRRKFEAYGIDVSPYVLTHSPVKEFLKYGSVTDIPCRDQSVDVSICIDTFQYLTKEEARQAVRELRRVTRQYLCFEGITEEDRKYAEQKENPDRLRRGRSLFTRAEIIKLFEEEGFTLWMKGFLPRRIEGWWYDFDFSFNAIFEVNDG